MAAVRLHVDVLGVGQDRRALVLHGLGSDCRTMWQVSGHLVREGYEVHAADLRGHGRSPAAERYAITDMVEDVALLGHGWDLVVGHSLGGAVLANLLTLDDFARRAVLIDPALRVVGDFAPMLADMILGEVGGQLTMEGIRARSPHWDPEDQWRKVQASATVSPRVVESCVYDSQPWDHVGTISRWVARVHILAADPSLGALFEPDTVPELAEMPHVTVTTVVGAGHSVHRDDIEAVLAVM